MQQGWPEEKCAECGLRAKLNMGCGSNEPLYLRLRPCGKCKQVRYCNRTCQLKHWKDAHKDECVIPGDEPPPPLKDELRALVLAGIEKRGLYVVAHTNNRPDTTGDQPVVGEEDLVTLHTVGFHEHGSSELLVRDLAHKRMNRTAGLLTYLRCERPLSKPLFEGESVTVNGLKFAAKVLAGEELEAANAHLVVAVRGYYCLKKSNGLVQVTELVFKADLGGSQDPFKGAEMVPDDTSDVDEDACGDDDVIDDDDVVDDTPETTVPLSSDLPPPPPPPPPAAKRQPKTTIVHVPN